MTCQYTNWLSIFLVLMCVTKKSKARCRMESREQHCWRRLQKASSHLSRVVRKRERDVSIWGRAFCGERTKVQKLLAHIRKNTQAEAGVKGGWQMNTQATAPMTLLATVGIGSYSEWDGKLLENKNHIFEGSLGAAWRLKPEEGRKKLLQ